MAGYFLFYNSNGFRPKIIIFFLPGFLFATEELVAKIAKRKAFNLAPRSDIRPGFQGVWHHGSPKPHARPRERDDGERGMKEGEQIGRQRGGGLKKTPSAFVKLFRLLQEIILLLLSDFNAKISGHHFHFLMCH